MSEIPRILCIGSVLWDVIGRASSHMSVGSDVPGRISRVPGGVALNIAMALRRFGLRPALLSAVGDDAEGRELLERVGALGLDASHVYVSPDLPTDRYMAVEGANGLIAAIADAHSLESAGDKILRPLLRGELGSAAAPFTGTVALDGNLTEALLAEIAADPAFARADLRVAPASPGKAERLLPLLTHPGATLYLNRAEAALLLHARAADSAEAARGLLARGARRVLVTDGAAPAAEGGPEGVRLAQPPEVLVTRVTGAGDVFMAAHMAAEHAGERGEAALAFALRAAADYISADPNQ